ncbi:hypothetical protein QQ045_010166 [Rhodiola kirilowii]
MVQHGSVRGWKHKDGPSSVSIDISNTWYENAPYCLAGHAQQVFYSEDPKLGDNWKVDNVVTQRGTYSDTCLSYNDNSYALEEAYQEDATTNITPYMCNAIDEEDDELDEGLETPRVIPAFYHDYDKQYDDDDAVETEEDESEYEDEDEDEEDDGLPYISDHELSDNEDEEDDEYDEYDEEED